MKNQTKKNKKASILNNNNKKNCIVRSDNRSGNKIGV